MRLSSRTVLCLMAIALPLGASAAAAKITLQDVLDIVQSNVKPLSFSLDMRGALDDVSATLNVTGTQNGDMKSLAEAAAEATIVLDAKIDARTKGRATLRAILVDETAYVRLDDFTVTGDWAALAEEVEPYMDTWYSFPVDPDEYADYMASNKNRRTSYKEIEGFFKIDSRELRNGTTRYTVTIPKNKQRRLFSRLLGPKYARSFKRTNLSFTLTVDAARSVFGAMTTAVDIRSVHDGSSARFTLKGGTKALSAKPVIAAPAQSTPWEEIVEQEQGRGIEDARNAQRRSDVNTILNAVYQYAIDHDGNLPPGLDDATRTTAICQTNERCDGLSLDALNGSYLIRMPTDPLQSDNDPASGYTIRKSRYGRDSWRITVAAPLAEGGLDISVTR